jgi:hypothetical protein
MSASPWPGAYIRVASEISICPWRAMGADGAAFRWYEALVVNSERLKHEIGVYSQSDLELPCESVSKVGGSEDVQCLTKLAWRMRRQRRCRCDWSTHKGASTRNVSSLSCWLRRFNPPGLSEMAGKAAIMKLSRCVQNAHQPRGFPPPYLEAFISGVKPRSGGYPLRGAARVSSMSVGKTSLLDFFVCRITLLPRNTFISPSTWACHLPIHEQVNACSAPSDLSNGSRLAPPAPNSPPSPPQRYAAEGRV